MRGAGSAMWWVAMRNSMVKAGSSKRDIRAKTLEKLEGVGQVDSSGRFPETAKRARAKAQCGEHV